jgi:hypothetical protein
MGKLLFADQSSGIECSASLSPKGCLESKHLRRLPHIRLVRRNNVLSALPLTPGNMREVGVVPLPKVPISLVHWLTALGQLFWSEHQKCLGLLLMLDLEYRRWTWLIPTQTCTSRGVQWKTKLSDMIDQPPHLLIAGSFQTTAAGGVFDAHALVPAFDGLHLVQQVDQQEGGAWSFIHCDTESALVDPLSILGDDLRDTLHRYIDRLA